MIRGLSIQNTRNLMNPLRKHENNLKAIVDRYLTARA